MINIIDIQITSICNRNCSYCYALKNQNIDMPFERIVTLIDQISLNKIENICISGGEPFNHPKIYEILEYCKSKSLNTAISTNGDNHEMIIKCLDLIDVIGFPIDSPNEFIHDSIRGLGSFRNIVNIIEIINFTNKNILIRIGTVLLYENQNDLLGIYYLINKYSKIKTWKIYEQIKYNSSKISTPDFKKITKNLIDKFYIDNNIIKIIISSKKNRNKGYFIVEPNGQIFIPALYENLDIKYYIGNIYNCDLNTLINFWNKHSNKKNHQNMADSIFNYKE